jgi:hypothetical protein
MNSKVPDVGWSSRWTTTWRREGGDVVRPVRDLAWAGLAGCRPVRRFSWRRGQRHRSGLLFVVSTGRHHGFESLEEARLLLALDFAGELVDVLCQPFRLRFCAGGRWREHVLDFLAETRTGKWLVDVRPAARIGADDLVAFAAAARAAGAAGWRYRVVTGWKRHAAAALDALSAQRRPLSDRLGLVGALLAAVASGPVRFGELAGRTAAPAVARAYLLNLLWRRRLGIDMSSPLGDGTLVHAGGDGRR